MRKPTSWKSPSLISPPVGLNLFVLASISKKPIATVIRGIVPYLLIMLSLLALITYVPAISTWLRDLVYGTPR